MKSNFRKALAFTALTLLLGGMATPAFAGVEPTAKCNSGRGNGSETMPANDCDPGNSGGHNNGGD
ncbi:MAG: hypothetical protein ACR2MO_04540 [Acidimicrobiales bacterium]